MDILLLKSSTTKLFSIWLLFLLFVTPCVPESDDVQPSVEATSPVPDIIEGGMISLHCVFNNFDKTKHIVTITRIVDGNTEHFSFGDGLTSSAEEDDRVFLAVRQQFGGKYVYFLTLIDVTQQDSGEYTCHINTNSPISEISQSSVTINVLYFPRSQPSCDPSNSPSAFFGDDLTFTCIAEQSNPPVDVKWIRTDSEEIMNSVQELTDAGQVYSELRLRVNAQDNGAVFVCEISSPYFPEVKLSCPVGPLSLSHNPSKPTLNINDKVTDKNTKPAATVTDSKTIDVQDTTRLSSSCQKTCSALSPPTIYWIIGTFVACFLALLFLIIGIALCIKLHSMTSPDFSDTLYSLQPSEDVYAQLEGRRLYDGNRLYMTLERPKKLSTSTNDPLNLGDVRHEGQYLVPVLGPQH